LQPVRLALGVAALALAAGGLVMDRAGLASIVILFVLVVPFEKLFPRHRQRLRRPQVGTDMTYALAGPLLSAVGLAAGVVVAAISLAWLPGLLLRPVVASIPGPALPLVGIALFDLAIYWTHRWYHEVPVLWRFHAVHHSPEHMDWISGFRSHPLDGTLIAPAFAFLLAAGFSPEFTGLLAVVQIVLGIFLHANVRWRLRWLHKLVITPEFHHWHHANEPGAVNSNYSVFLPAWDLMFGTYFMPEHRRPQRYGVNEDVPTGLVPQLWYPLRGMGNPLRAVRHPVRSVRVGGWFGRALVGDLWRSARRPRRRSHDDVAPGLDQPMATAHLGPASSGTVRLGQVPASTEVMERPVPVATPLPPWPPPDERFRRP
jgi:sterol desaturase/sphingolipid hydroxylase (fatty acid hydroxylase superfamily)